jgi:hypothetical protein
VTKPKSSAIPTTSSGESLDAAAPKDGENRLVATVIDRIVAPFAGGDHASVDPQDLAELETVKGGERRVVLRCPPTRQRGNLRIRCFDRLHPCLLSRDIPW